MKLNLYRLTGALFRYEHVADYYHLGIALQARGRTSEVIEVLETALSLFEEQGNAESMQIISELLRTL